MDTKYRLVYESSAAKVVKAISEIFPWVGVAVLLHDLVVKAVNV